MQLDSRISTLRGTIHYMNEVARFFSHWLASRLTGIEREKPVSVYFQRPTAADRRARDIAGFWSDLDDLPADAFRWRLRLAAGERLVDEAGDVGPPESANASWSPIVGVANGLWSAGGLAYYLAADQRSDEARSLVFTSEPIAGDRHILGRPRVRLRASADAPNATVVCKLAEVLPNGQSILIVDGSLNLTRRCSLERPEPAIPGEACVVEIPLPPTGWILRSGSRLRLAIATGDFPNLWPAPKPFSLSVYFGGQEPSLLELPFVTSTLAPSNRFSPPPESSAAQEGETSQEYFIDELRNAAKFTFQSTRREHLDDNLGDVEYHTSFDCRTQGATAVDAQVESRHQFALTVDGTRYETLALVRNVADSAAFHLSIETNVLVDGASFFSKNWTHTQPRRWL